MYASGGPKCRMVRKLPEAGKASAINAIGQNIFLMKQFRI
jgi:hypothetical protein